MRSPRPLTAIVPDTMKVVNSDALASPISTTGERVRIFHMLRDTTALDATSYQ
jgi:hypothetical protein